MFHFRRNRGSTSAEKPNSESSTSPGQPGCRRLPREEWTVFLPSSHPGYISWGQFEANQTTLLESAGSVRGDRRRSAPREGVALLQGIVVCGRCGKTA